MTVYAAMRDKTIAPPKQLKMARKLGAVAYEAHARHLGTVTSCSSFILLANAVCERVRAPSPLLKWQGAECMHNPNAWMVRKAVTELSICFASRGLQQLHTCLQMLCVTG